jgi:hypothetical protein
VAAAATMRSTSARAALVFATLSRKRLSTAQAASGIPEAACCGAGGGRSRIDATLEPRCWRRCCDGQSASPSWVTAG